MGADQQNLDHSMVAPGYLSERMILAASKVDKYEMTIAALEGIIGRAQKHLLEEDDDVEQMIAVMKAYFDSMNDVVASLRKSVEE